MKGECVLEGRGVYLQAEPNLGRCKAIHGRSLSANRRVRKVDVSLRGGKRKIFSKRERERERKEKDRVFPYMGI